MTMDRSIVWVATFCALALVPLAGRPPRGEEGRPSTVVLTAGNPVRCPADGEVTVTLLAVVGDSRCPLNVLCVRAGGVRLEISARRGDEAPVSFVLDSDRGDGTGEMCGLRFRILAVEPGRKPGEKLPLSSYIVTLEVGPARG